MPAKELSVKTRVVFVAIFLAALTLFGSSVNESAAPVAIQDAGQDLPVATSPAPTSQSIATLPEIRSVTALPTITPPRETEASSTTPPRAGYAAASLPSLDPQRTITALPTVTPSREPEPERDECDPAYPDKRTCIPPGPPFDQGCAITEERRFEVLAPDPQGLDHDGDGIGCEPVRNR